VVLVALLGTLFLAGPAAADEPIPPWRRLYLVWPGSSLHPCRAPTDRKALLILRPGTAADAAKTKPEFFVLPRPSGLTKGQLVEVISGCEEHEESNATPEGVLQLEREILWDDDPVLAVKGQQPTPRQVGSVTPITDRAERKPYLDVIRGHLPREHEFYVRQAVRVAVPGSEASYIFVGAAHFKPEQEREGEKSYRTTGFLFLPDARTPRVLVQEPGLGLVLGLTDLDGDGIAEVLVHDGEGLAGQYNIRLFDGKTLSEPKISLYEWVD
jgi:hypothetical protein